MKEVASIIIINYNNFGSDVCQCLETIWKDPFSDQVEVILVDNNSLDSNAIEALKNF